MVIVYLPDHAMLAVNLGQRADEHNIMVRGAPHVLLDPTGPAQLKLGKLSEKTSGVIRMHTKLAKNAEGKVNIKATIN